VLCGGPAVWLAGCGDSVGGNAIEVDLQATVQTGPSAVDGITLTAGAGGSFRLNGATARVERPDGTSAAVSLSLGAGDARLILGPAALVAAGDGGAQGGAPQADVRLEATFDVSQPDRVNQVVVRAVDPGDTFDITGATAEVRRPDRTVDPVALDISADGRQVTLGSFSVATQPGQLWYWWLNTVEIQGPVTVTDGPTGTQTQVGSLAFSFAAPPGEDFVAPTQVEACVPTLGAASEPRVIARGLRPKEDYAWIAITDKDGGVTYSRARYANASGVVTLPDTLGQFTADRISGPGTRIEIAFAADDKYPPPPVYPPYADGGGPGTENRSLDDLNVLIIQGPLSVMDNLTKTAVELGDLRFGFEVLGDGTVVAPTDIRFSLPTRGVAPTQSVAATGLAEGDSAQAVTVDRQGHPTGSTVVQAEASGQALIPDALGGITATGLSGPDTSYGLYFWRTAGP
jgi:hypothetical protein